MSDDFDKYLAIANDDIQRANDYGQLKSYVASILYDHDKKTELLQQKENIIKEVREYLDKYSRYSSNKEYFSTRNPITDLKIILDKENK